MQTNIYRYFAYELAYILVGSGTIMDCIATFGTCYMKMQVHRKI